MAFSFLFGDANVQIRLQNGQIVQGEFVGTYMNHVHILVEEKIIYYACDDITSITYSAILRFDYDCSINTVTADILFPPQLDPMTGEITQMLPEVSNPETRELIKDQIDTDEIDIWNKKIPPSVYLEKLSKDSERPYRFMSCGMMFFLFGAGSGIHFGRVDSVETELVGQFFSVVGTLCYAAGLYYTSRILSKRDAGKQFENIKNIQDKNEKEKLAYESLVALAQKSRSTRQIGTVAGFPVTIIKNKHRPQMTIEEKALDDYLNQIPIVSAFKGVSTIIVHRWFDIKKKYNI